MEANRDSHDGLGVFGDECLRAAKSLSSLEWRVVREERFHLTPVGMFNEIVKNSEAFLRRSAGEEKRRQAWLADDGDEEEHDAAAAADAPGFAAPGSRKDVFDCDLDRFCPLAGPRSRPPHWKDLQQQQ